MYTYDDKYRHFYEEVWDLLVNDAGASKDPLDKESFVCAFTKIEYPTTEYRFCGSLGFGGKFWRNNGFYISCYREDETPKQLGTINRVNEQINKLVDKHHPKDR
jgi:hypothetical protein